MRRFIALLCAAAILWTGVFASFDINVSFKHDYISEGENRYNVFGENNTGENKNVQLISVTYENGRASGTKVSDAYTIAPNSKFDFTESFLVPEGTDTGNSSVRLFVWDKIGKISPLTEPYTPNGVGLSIHSLKRQRLLQVCMMKMTDL